jgi:hypothetical protein
MSDWPFPLRGLMPVQSVTCNMGLWLSRNEWARIALECGSRDSASFKCGCQTCDRNDLPQRPPGSRRSLPNPIGTVMIRRSLKLFPQIGTSESRGGLVGCWRCVRFQAQAGGNHPG